MPGDRMLLEHGGYCTLGMDALVRVEQKRCYALGVDALVTVCSWNATSLCGGHACSGDRMLLEHERYHTLGMDALATVGHKL